MMLAIQRYFLKYCFHLQQTSQHISAYQCGDGFLPFSHLFYKYMFRFVSQIKIKDVFSLLAMF